MHSDLLFEAKGETSDEYGGSRKPGGKRIAKGIYHWKPCSNFSVNGMEPVTLEWEEDMRIGELHKTTGVGIETIRYYEKTGLLPAPARTNNGYRDYGPAHLERLSFIRHCRALDLPLAEIRQVLDFIVHPEADCSDINCLIDEQIARVRARIKAMRALEKQLSQLRAHCGAGRTAAECGILRELAASAHPRK